MSINLTCACTYVILFSLKIAIITMWVLLSLSQGILQLASTCDHETLVHISGLQSFCIFDNSSLPSLLMSYIILVLVAHVCGDLPHNENVFDTHHPQIAYCNVLMGLKIVIL